MSGGVPLAGLTAGNHGRRLEAGEIADYLRSRPGLARFAPSGRELSVREVGDGNLNLVFVVRSEPDRPGVVLKQSLPYVRSMGESWPLTLERAAAEARAFEAYTRFAPELLPAWYGYDPDRHVLAMEDLADLRVWRAALNDGEVHLAAAAAIGRLVGRIAFHTSDFGTEAKARKALLAGSVNPELCEITEDLVFTEPLVDHEHNHWPPGVTGLVRELQRDPRLRTEFAELKHRFMTHGEALIHGDLHTGSVMVGGGRAVVIDLEFSFYGPVGFDLGMFWANAVFAAARAERLGRDAVFRGHVDRILAESWAAFVTELRGLWPTRVDRFFDDTFLERYLAATWTDALGYAAAEAIRRTVGYAHISDLDSLPEPARSSAAEAVLRVARWLALERRGIDSPGAAWSVVREEVER